MCHLAPASREPRQLLSQSALLLSALSTSDKIDGLLFGAGGLHFSARDSPEALAGSCFGKGSCDVEPKSCDVEPMRFVEPNFDGALATGRTGFLAVAFANCAKAGGGFWTWPCHFFVAAFVGFSSDSLGVVARGFSVTTGGGGFSFGTIRSAVRGGTRVCMGMRGGGALSTTNARRYALADRGPASRTRLESRRILRRNQALSARLKPSRTAVTTTAEDAPPELAVRLDSGGSNTGSVPFHQRHGGGG